MHTLMLQQFATDRVAELRADAQRARHQHDHRVRRASERGQSMARRQWRVLLEGLMAR
jgi:hypothetical protein